MITTCILLTMTLCHAIRDKPVLILGVTQGIAMTLDTQQTLYYNGHQQRGWAFHEIDPITRPLLTHPAGYYGLEAAVTIGSMWLGEKMRRSHNRIIRGIWWLPQTYEIGAAAAGYGWTRGHAR